jgi:glycosyltransferase involved in cell wall biosynthesis
MDAPNVLALIPAYNEAQRITPVIVAALEHLPVLVVDDGSKDETASVAQTAGATVLRQVPNQGKGAALRAGLRWGLDQGYEAVLTLDADGQHDPGEIPAFLARQAAGRPDLLIGSRDFGQMPLSRRMANTLGRWSFSWALGQRVEDNQSGYRLLSRRMAEAVLDSQEHGFEFEVEMIVTCVQRGYVLDWVPIRTIYGDQGSHIDPWTHARNWVRIVRQTRRTVKASRQVNK